MPIVPAAIRTLLICDLLILIAQMVGYIAIPWWIAHEGGAADLATYGFVLAIGALISLPLLAPLGERRAKRTQVAGGLTLLCVVTSLLATLACRGSYTLPVLILLGMLAVIADNVVTPALAAITAELVSPLQLPNALRQRKSAQAVGRLLGPIVGGSGLALAGVGPTLWLQFVLLSVAAIFSLRLPRQTAPHASPRSTVARWWSDAKAGAHAKWGVPIERGWTAVNFVVWIFVGPAVGLLIPLKVQSLGLSATWLGACEAGLSAGLLAGSLVGLPLLVGLFGRLHVRVGAAIAEGLALAVAGYVHSPTLLILAYFCTGFANTLMTLVGATHRALAVPPDFRVRMTAVNMMASQIAGSIGVAIAGVTLARWPVANVYSVFGLMASVAAMLFLRIPRAAEFFALEHAHASNWYRAQYPAAFGASSSENIR